MSYVLHTESAVGRRGWKWAGIESSRGIELSALTRALSPAKCVAGALH